MEIKTRHNVPRPKTVRTVVALLIALVIVLLLAPSQIGTSYKSSWKSDLAMQTFVQSNINIPQQKVHILLPATKSSAKFCKTLLTLTILGYPTPRIISWDGTDKKGALLGGGSHFAKITQTLEFIDEHLSGPESQDDLIVTLDAFDIWLQLPFEVLLARYRAILREDDARIAHRMGRAFDQEEIQSGIVFAAGKRCGPNFLHTVACYPVPESPLPMDLFGNSTDTPMGHTPWSSFRTRYLNSGLTMGPVKMLRPVLQRAQEKLLECENRKNADFDTGTGHSDFCYHGSDQSVWNEIFGEQEFHREVMRRHHRSASDAVLDMVNAGRAGSAPPPSQVYGVPISDYLDPSFYHQANNKTYIPGKPFEFGLSLDYWSELSHQTSNAYRDAQFVRGDRPLEDQVGKRNAFDCMPKSPDWDEVPGEMLSSLLPGKPDKWQSMPFYTEFCVGQIPVMVHHNSVDKGEIARQWNRAWWYESSRDLLEAKRREGASIFTSGLLTDVKDVTLKWDELCPSQYDADLFPKKVLLGSQPGPA